MKAFESIIDELKHQQVTCLFTLLSEETAILVTRAKERGIDTYGTRHEHAAVGMADGYSRVSGRVGVAVLGRGPGLTNALNALIVAAKNRSRVVVLAGDGPSNFIRSGVKGVDQIGKHIEQQALLDALGIKNVTLLSAKTARHDIAAVFDAAREGATVVIDLPVDMLHSELADELYVAEQRSPQISRRATPSREEILAVVDLIETGWAASSRPVILAGAGAVRSGARAQLTRLGDRIGAIFGTTLLGKSLFRGMAFDIGLVGSISTPIASELLARADLVLVFGASLNSYTTYDKTIFRNARVVQVDVNSRAFAQHYPVELTITGDAAETAAALADELERRAYSSSGFRSTETAAAIGAFHRDDGFRDQSSEGSLDPRTVLATLDRLLPEDRVLVFDPGYHIMLSGCFLSVGDPVDIILPIEYNAVGTGQGVALGAAVARRDRPVVLVIGDGGLMMTLGDLDTAVRYGLRVFVIVCDDSGFGAEVHFLAARGFSVDQARYANPSFAAIAAAMGAESTTVGTTADLEALPKRLAEMKPPLLIHCRINGDVASPFES